MIQFFFPPSGLIGLRIAYSPIWECVISLRLLRDRSRTALFGPWGHRTAALDASDLDLLQTVVRDDGGYIPDFLAPPPSGPGQSIQAELDRLRSTPPELLAAEISRAVATPGHSAGARILSRHAMDPLALREALAGAIERYWRAVVAPEWSRIEAVLEADMMLRGRMLALHGAAEVLGALHPAVRLRPGALEVESRQEGTVQVDTGEILLVPSVFGAPDVFTSHGPPWRASLYYPARGAGTLWGVTPVPAAASQPRDPLVLLTGRTRARILRALVEPATTTELAMLLGAAPASVSAHLRGLWTAGLLQRTRVGRRVFYAASATGRQVMEAVG